MNSTVPIVCPPNEAITVAAFWFSRQASEYKNALVNGVLSQTVAGLVCQAPSTAVLI